MRGYRMFLAASGLANLADGVATVAWLWVATLLTRDAALIALVPVALRLPWLLFALPAGIVADRMDRRRLIVTMDGLRAAGFGAAALALWVASPLPAAPASGVSSVPLFVALCLSALTVGVAEVFRDNAAQSFLPALVASEGLERANARLWLVESVGNALVGPALGAAALGLALALPFAGNALAYGLAGLMIAGIAGVQAPPRATASRNWRRELVEGWAFLRASPLLRMLAVATGFWNMFDSMVMFALVLLAQEKLGLPAGQYGMVLAAAALGGIASGLVGDRVVRAMGAVRLMRVAMFSGAPCFAAMALAPGPVTVGLALGMAWFWGLNWNIVSVSTRQRLVPDAIRGRVNSLYRLMAWGMMPVGSVLAGQVIGLSEGPMGRIAALEAPLWIAALGTLLLTALVWRPLGTYLPQVLLQR
ncbi:MFS transporter [Gemmobacter lutimaris]|uniref:MFS transporter n=1 Tax=Gemmobacter lutimaris TaxID=2306023 RepID=A0A398BW69_9RHOB|nr:MFS transporter [Gemmobacter lutimaris]RID92180.1 MFS transporter [Gemmobacter lutimaris]